MTSKSDKPKFPTLQSILLSCCWLLSIALGVFLAVDLIPVEAPLKYILIGVCALWLIATIIWTVKASRKYKHVFAWMFYLLS
jgi:hypothetical protein